MTMLIPYAGSQFEPIYREKLEEARNPKPLSLPMCRTDLRLSTKKPMPKMEAAGPKLLCGVPPVIKQIMWQTALRFNVSVIDIRSHRRQKDVVLPRHIAIYLCRKHTLRSLPYIGRMFGRRDHTTILHAIRKIEDMIAAGGPIVEHLRAIEAGIVAERQARARAVRSAA